MVTMMPLALASSLYAQDSLQEVIDRSESLRERYRFSEAIELCEEAMEKYSPLMESDSLQISESDSLLVLKLEESLNLSRNGGSMLRYCSTPRVVSKKRVSMEDFFLYYPSEDGIWVPSPSVFSDSLDSRLTTYFPEGSENVYFSKKDEEGSINIYYSEKADTIWTAPQIVDEALTSSSDEIFPVLSNDGKSLHFSSNGFYGVGGYDLYVSRWNDALNSWGAPENLGFPYSSPYNDYLFVNSHDGKYSVFASDRECPGTGDVFVYVLEYDDMPIRRSVPKPEDLESLCRLDIPVGKSAEGEDSNTEADGPDNDYSLQYAQVQKLQQQIMEKQKALNGKRTELAQSSEDEKQALTQEIIEEENTLMNYQSELNSAAKKLQDMEMALLLEGTIPSEVLNQDSQSRSTAQKSFSFLKHQAVQGVNIRFMKPKQIFDYSFMILPEGRFAENNEIPGGLVYQIQIFSKTNGEAEISDLKGLSPVFSRSDQAGKITYYAGLFRTYNDVLSNLNKVKKAGFRTAFIVAFMDGKKLNITEARKLEKTIEVNYQIHITPADGRLSDRDLAAIKAATTKDMIREVVDGRTSYVLGPYSDSIEASTVVSALKAAGMEEVSLKTLL